MNELDPVYDMIANFRFNVKRDKYHNLALYEKRGDSQARPRDNAHRMVIDKRFREISMKQWMQRPKMTYIKLFGSLNKLNFK